MLQPFILLEQKHLELLEKTGKVFLVTQRYHFGANHLQNDDDKIDLLVSDYPNRGLADIHYNAVRGNPIKVSKDIQDAAALLTPDKEFSAVIDLRKGSHYQTLLRMLEGDKYRLYWDFTLDKLKVRETIRVVYGARIYSYLTNELKLPIKGSDKVEIKEGVIFGELFVNLRWNSFKKRLPLLDIENYKKP
ncbi:MAG: hypothetical protein EOO03_11765 [Chitinophagaceae bacterium]|nr:MAG: hypothetical protein EOO03_11765 [Chitinophagaceae bacterium]